MRSSRIAVVVGLAAALVVASAFPANADPVTSDVPADTWVDLNTEIFSGDFTPLFAEGPATFPVSVTNDFANLAASALRVGTPEGCTRMADGMTISLSSVGVYYALLSLAFGSTSTKAAVEGIEYEYAGQGSVALTSGGVVSVTFGIEEPQSGTLTMTLDEPIPADEAFFIVGLFGAEGNPVTVESATFSVIDDCVTPVPDAPAALAATGVDAGPVVGAGAALLLLGGAAAAIAMRRRAA